jgi:regulator of protease activity HflC (stomatin/prohibitin superfamily)
MEIEAERRAAEAEAQVIAHREQLAQMLEQYPSLLRLLELEALQELAKSSNARIYLGFDRPGCESTRVQD